LRLKIGKSFHNHKLGKQNGYEEELPMSIVAKVGTSMQLLFGTIAEEAGKKTKIIVRQRKFTCFSLLKTFVLGFLQKPDASDEDLAQMAVQCGADVTPQAVEQRHTSKLVKFLEEVFRGATKLVVESTKSLAPILDRFEKVVVLDSTTTTLPDSMEKEFRGCGGSYQSGKSAIKFQTELDLRSGALTNIQIEQGRSPDSATSRQEVDLPAGSLRIADLGYFNLAVFASMVLARVHYLSRFQFNTGVMELNGAALDLLPWLSKQAGPIVDQMVLLGNAHRLPSRMIAWRLPQEQADRRRHKLRLFTRRKRGQEPSPERLAWCDWTILVTSVPVEMLSAVEAIVLYRARWQIELLFKRWKSQGLVAKLSGSTEVRQMVRVWARMIAAPVQHWLVVTCSWGDPTRSWGKVCEAIRAFVGRIAAALGQLLELSAVIDDLCAVVAKTCQRNKRRKPGTVELLNDVTLLDFCLT
jgi:Transposase DDE domain